MSGTPFLFNIFLVWEFAFYWLLNSRGNTPIWAPAKTSDILEQLHQDIDTWYHHETLRNDRGDTKNDDSWYICWPDFIANIKSPGTMRDTQKTMTISATSFRGCNRFSPLLIWNYMNTCCTRCLYLFIMLLTASEAVGLIFLSTFVSIHLTTYVSFYLSTFVRFFSFPSVCIYWFPRTCYLHIFFSLRLWYLNLKRKRQPAPSCSISRCVLLPRSWTILSL